MKKILELLNGKHERIAKKKVAKKMAVGTAIGAVSGLIAGIFFAPKSGKESREIVKNGIKDTAEKINDAANKAKQVLDSAVGEVSDKINEFKDKKGSCCKDKESESKSE